MPASFNTLLATSPTASPTPWGAGLSVTSTAPLLPVTRNRRAVPLGPRADDRLSVAASGRLQFRLHGVKLLRDLLADVGASDPVLRGQHLGAVGDRHAGIEQALQRREESAPPGRALPADVEDGLLQAFRGRASTREETGQVGGRQVPGPGGPAVLLEIDRLGGREDLVPRGVRDDELDDRLVQRLPHDDPRLAAPEELRAHTIVRPALPPPTERDAVVRTLLLFHFGASLSAPAARNCCSI